MRHPDFGGPVKTEHTQCPECEFDGPHTDNEDGTLECGSCYSEFENPFHEGGNASGR